MSIPPRLAGNVNETLGADASGDLVIWLDEMRAEHVEMREAMRADFAEMRQEMRAMEARLGDRLSTQMTDVRGAIHSVETKLGERIHRVEVDLGRRIEEVSKEVEKSGAALIRWSFVFLVSAVAAMAMLAGVLRP